MLSEVLRLRAVSVLPRYRRTRTVSGEAAIGKQRKERLQWFHIKLLTRFDRYIIGTHAHFGKRYCGVKFSCEILVDFTAKETAVYENVEDAMSGSTPKKPVLNRENKSSSSVSDFYRLCKCSFKTIYGNFPSKTSLASFPENDSPRHHISAQKIFLMSRVEKEKKGLH